MVTTIHNFAPNPTVVCAELDGEAILLDAQSGIYFGLDAVGTDIWRLLERGADSRQIVEELLADYDVERERLVGDVNTFIEHLRRQGLVAAVGG
jgi:chromosome condensin MukBEF MukE localization factor